MNIICCYLQMKEGYRCDVVVYTDLKNKQHLTKHTCKTVSVSKRFIAIGIHLLNLTTKYNIVVAV